MKISTIASDVGKGLAAGLAGTAAMTVSSTLEQHLHRRAASTAPADAAAKVLGIREFESADAKNRFSNVVHWGFGTGWGVLRGLLAVAGLRGPSAAAAHGLAVWGNAQVMLPVLDVAPPSYLWPREELAIDAFHHAVYATATGIAYDLLDKRAA